MALEIDSSSSVRFHGTMAYCYRCGQHITNTERRVRRIVKTGESVRLRYPKRHMAGQNTNYGMRIVCRWCAKAIDLEYKRLAIRSYAELALAILILGVMIFVLFMRQVP